MSSCMSEPGPNAAMATHWSAEAGPRWVRWEPAFDRQIAPIGDAVMAKLAPHAGERVLDVGCGFGITTVALGKRVGASGRVLGVDLSAPMLARARERAAALGHVAFLEADAQTHAFPPHHTDAIFSRFGVMFFTDPVAAFANLRRAATAQGRLAFCCWQAVDRNPWRSVPLAAVARVATLPAPPAPDAPGPFAFADAGRVRAILDAAGWHGVGVDAWEHEVWLGATSDLDETVAFVMETAGPAASLQQSGAVDADMRQRIAEAVRDALAPFQVDGGVRMSAAAWIVTARAA
jgi:SAM-dependent methyltransferase